MTLIEAVRGLDSLDEGSTIYAVAPWTENSEVVVAPEPKSGGLPAGAKMDGLSYFLEVFLARDFLADWAAALDREPTASEKSQRLIQYASTDA